MARLLQALFICALASFSACALTPPDPVVPESMRERMRKIEINDTLTAATAGRLEQVAGILKREPRLIHVCNDVGATFLSRAVGAANEDLVRFLLEQGADVDEPCAKFWPVLHSAAANKKGMNILMLLLNHGADVKALDGHGRTPLKMAVFGNNWEGAELLLAHGAEMDIFDAAALGKTLRMREMLNHDPKLLEATDSTGKTPLHAAASAGRKAAVELLIDRGAYRFARDRMGWTPADWAREKKHREVADLLR